MTKILLIEDNLEMRENTGEILELSGYEVVSAGNGKEGVELARKEIPDLIICDIMMPLLDGYGVLHLLSKNSETATIPFIFLTAKAERIDFRKGMEMGADDYITKPFDDVELLNAIESRLKKSALIKKEFTPDLNGLNELITNANELEVTKKLTSINAKTKKYTKKESVYNEGSTPRGFFYVVKGKVKTFRTHDLGKDLITGIYTEGDFFGYLPLFSNSSYSDSAETMEESELSIIPNEDFLSLIFQNREVSISFIKILSQNLADRENQLMNLAYNSVRKRVADALVSLYRKSTKENPDSTQFKISREDLANYVGTATETTIRTLSDMKQEGLIDLKGGTITILNAEKLENMRN